MREDSYSKARRYVVEGRLILTIVGGDRVEGWCRGDDFYRVSYIGNWSCTCPAVTDQCAHIRAAKLVTAPEAAKTFYQDMRLEKR